ncbi:terminase family protein [Flavicella sp.]|uniref:terminase large subunit domain-containing protein n=1 Tax=Flavicella sp. TaxID=2957742 RepID=UPI00301931DA
MEEINIIQPQKGYQMMSLASSADIVIGGGAAGVGKTFSLLLEPLRHKDVSDFGGVIFRRTSPQIKAQGGLWDTSMSLYSLLDATPKETNSSWTFSSGARLKFNHLEYEKNVYDWQGSQIPFIGFDELTHFSSNMFFYLLSRNRSTCGVKPYVRATCNPDPDSWVADIISWWIDQDTGFPIPEREGVLRYFMRDGDTYIWGGTPEEVIKKAMYLLEPIMAKTDIDPKDMVKSITFISGDIYSNKKLLEANPEYLANLLAQDEDTKAQLLEGNWKIRLDDKDLYDYHKFRDVFTNTHVKGGSKYITSDIALKGSDKMVLWVWDGFIIIDVMIVNKSNGKQVIDAITELKNKHGVPNSNITFDNDGVGGFVDGFIEGAIEFKNGGTPKNGENYANLKTQCYYKSADRVNNGGIFILEEVANRMYDDKTTIRQRLMQERKAIKKFKTDEDGKLRILPKSEMKKLNKGESPDLFDAFMEREIFELTGKITISETTESASALGF